MPVFLEYDKTNGKITRVLSAPQRPQDAMHLAYQEIPSEAENVPVSGSIERAREIIAGHLEEHKENGYIGEIRHPEETDTPFEKV